MASPGQFAYNLDGQPIYFINSDDNKIRITGYAPEAVIDELGIVYPGTGALTTAGAAPKLTGIAWPTTKALTFTTYAPVLGEATPAPTPGLVAVALAGQTPVVGRGRIPAVGSLSLTGSFPQRWTGIKFESDAPTLVYTLLTTPTVGSLSFAAVAPDVSPDTARVPEQQSIALSGQTPTIAGGNLVLPTTAAVTYVGQWPNANPVSYPGKASLGITGQQVIPVDPAGQVTIVIGGPYEEGTFIRNLDAEFDDGLYNIDARTGFKQKPGKLVKDAYGVWTRPDSADKIHPADIPHKTRTEKADGPLRPSDVGRERFVDEEYPDGVDPDTDL